jgi:hypothetical protein
MTFGNFTMHPELGEYLQCIDLEDIKSGELVEASYLEAQRIMSPQGLENYLVGIKSMCTLGKGQDLVLTYVQEMPVVAKEVGEDIVPDTIEAIMRWRQHASAMPSYCAVTSSYYICLPARRREGYGR